MKHLLTLTLCVAILCAFSSGCQQPLENASATTNLENPVAPSASQPRSHKPAVYSNENDYAYAYGYTDDGQYFYIQVAVWSYNNPWGSGKGEQVYGFISGHGYFYSAGGDTSDVKIQVQPAAGKGSASGTVKISSYGYGTLSVDMNWEAAGPLEQGKSHSTLGGHGVRYKSDYQYRNATLSGSIAGHPITGAGYYLVGFVRGNATSSY